MSRDGPGQRNLSRDICSRTCPGTTGHRDKNLFLSRDKGTTGRPAGRPVPWKHYFEYLHNNCNAAFLEKNERRKGFKIKSIRQVSTMHFKANQGACVLLPTAELLLRIFISLKRILLKVNLFQNVILVSSNSSEKTNENKSTLGIILDIRFFERTEDTKKSF